jgi:cytochrome c-type biogenesis protein CcmE
MTRKRKRLIIVLSGVACLGVAVALTLTALQDTLVFFVSPSEIATKAPAPGRSFRLGGLVEKGSVRKIEENGKPVFSFRVSDGTAAVQVNFAGILPDLFREGQGVVALGTMRGDGFVASEVLAKHDETYMPKEVAEALKKSGQWNPGSGPPPPAATWNTLDAKAQGAAPAAPGKGG